MKTILRNLKTFTRKLIDYRDNYKLDNVVLGMSGGIDSPTAYLRMLVGMLQG